MKTKIMLEPGAIMPVKAHEKDTGYDLWAIKVIMKQIDGVILLGTGIKIQPPKGYYFEIIPRSSIWKKNLTMPNSIGVIDESYRGELMIPVLKIDDETAIPELPAKIAQLVLRKRYESEFEQVDSLDKTDRGDGGIGSTG